MKGDRRNMGAEKKTYSFTLETALMDRIALCAKAENRNLSNMVGTILLRYLEKQEKKQ